MPHVEFQSVIDQLGMRMKLLSSHTRTGSLILLMFAAMVMNPVRSAAQLKTTGFGPITKFKSLTVLLTPQGPHISGAAVASQPLFLTIVNRSGIRTLHVSLTQNSALHSASASDVATELVGVDHKDGANDQTMMIELHPGVYFLSVREKLSWTVRLVVNP